jgi:hypothetical protein
VPITSVVGMPADKALIACLLTCRRDIGLSPWRKCAHVTKGVDMLPADCGGSLMRSSDRIDGHCRLEDLPVSTSPLRPLRTCVDACTVARLQAWSSLSASRTRDTSATVVVLHPNQCALLTRSAVSAFAAVGGADTAVRSTTAFGAAHSAAPCSGFVSSSTLLTTFSGCAGCLLMLTA